ncbi:MAG: TonB-dependent receptor plug domain-containing protein, partial [candidate division Zixibacteria bacterium]|nr:TonB-dependent receptor plug domain-containing protein [candidate division Zixibacteria bacterium]
MGIRAESTLGDEHSPTELRDSIVVTANRFGLSPKKSVWPTTIVKVDQVTDQSSLETALDGRGGLDIRGYNGVGSVSTLSSWGVFNRHMLLLYDGRAVKDYSLGGFNLSDYSPEEFERVEMLKGPQSAFYGSDAVGGVVNLIAKSALVDRVEIVS